MHAKVEGAVKLGDESQMPHLGRGLHSLAAQGPLRDHIDGSHVDVQTVPLVFLLDLGSQTAIAVSKLPPWPFSKSHPAVCFVARTHIDKP